MKPQQERLQISCREWLTHQAMPLWLNRGIDRDQGGFFEALSTEAQPLDLPRRATVQARQIYSVKTAFELGTCDRALGLAVIDQGMDHLLQKYSLPSGAFMYSIHANGTPANASPELYAQAFALFGMAHVHALRPDAGLKSRALKLVNYLSTERRVRGLKGVGFTELTPAGLSYQSNPHMHLFESAITWMEIDSDPVWKNLATEILELALTRFIDSETGLLAEQFDENWKIIRHDSTGGVSADQKGRFIFEPGHQYEWSWLMGRYEACAKNDPTLNQRSLFAIRSRLFELAEKHGTWNPRKSTYDQVWSDFTPKVKSARFWPQCERIKAALLLASEQKNELAAAPFYLAADEAMGNLFKFLETPVPGLWWDVWEECGSFKVEPSRASTFYHLIGAMAEYLKFKPSLPR